MSDSVRPHRWQPTSSPVPGILQARTLEWVAFSFSNAGKWKVKVKSLSHARLLATPWTAAYQAPLPMGFSRQEYWSGVPYVINYFSPCCFQNSMSLAVDNLIIMCLGMDFFKFILLDISWASWMFIFMSFIRFGTFSAIISSNILSTVFSLFPSPSGASTMHVSVCLVVFHRSFKVCSLFCNLFYFFSSDLVISIVLSSSSSFPGAQTAKKLCTIRETRIQSLGWEDAWRKDWLPIPVF